MQGLLSLNQQALNCHKSSQGVQPGVVRTSAQEIVLDDVVKLLQSKVKLKDSLEIRFIISSVNKSVSL